MSIIFIQVYQYIPDRTEGRLLWQALLQPEAGGENFCSFIVSDLNPTFNMAVMF
jgi:hypothetical protein